MSWTVRFDAVSPFDPAQPGKFLKLAGTCPTRLILAHFHGMDFVYTMAYRVVRDYSWWPGHVYHDISWIGQAFAGGPFEEQFVWLMRQVGLDRVLYGSDWPQCDPAESLAAARSLGLTDAEQEQLLYSTAAELLRL
jgi:predicted TIM-barrel fold metal-dependent hydrolase